MSLKRRRGHGHGSSSSSGSSSSQRTPCQGTLEFKFSTRLWRDEASATGTNGQRDGPESKLPALRQRAPRHSCACLNADQTDMVFCDGSEITLWDVSQPSTLRERTRIRVPPSYVVRAISHGMVDGQDTYFMTADEKYVDKAGAEGFRGAVLVYWGFRKGALPFAFRAHKRGHIQCSLFHGKRRELITSGVGGIVKVWVFRPVATKTVQNQSSKSNPTFKCPLRLSLLSPDGEVTAMAADEESNRIFSAINGDVHVWDVMSGNELMVGFELRQT